MTGITEIRKFDGKDFVDLLKEVADAVEINKEDPVKVRSVFFVDFNEPTIINLNTKSVGNLYNAFNANGSAIFIVDKNAAD